MTEKAELGLKKLDKGDAKAVFALSNDYADAFDYSLKEVRGLITRKGAAGYLAVAQTDAGAVPVGMILGYPSADFSDVWKGYAAKDLPGEYVGKDRFYLEALAVAPELEGAKGEVAGALLKVLESELLQAGYKGITSVLPIQDTTGSQPEALGFETRKRLEHFWVYESAGEKVDDTVDVIYKSLVEPAKAKK
ncbi:MAG: hypothetical protein HZB67_06220 [Candidatus Aenigmarchaeota archaeon]|nr:hypothetical protein [Candidatus Aenigmarchaeota archaeon]